MKKSFLNKKLSALDARYEAQKIAFAPLVFQVTRLLLNLGILKAIDSAGEGGLDVCAIAEKVKISKYGVTVLLETGLSAGVVDLNDDNYLLTKVGDFFLHDELTKINLNFNHDVNYRGMFHLEEAIKEGKPSGLQVFGKWKTVYEALAHLPEKVKKSWFEFDHFYSDAAYPPALREVFSFKPGRLLDIGANTGKWTIECLKHDPDVHVTMLDLPGQIQKAVKNVDDAGFSDRCTECTLDILDSTQKFPAGQDAVWMSQLLCCFSEDEIIGILKRSADALCDDGRVFILDTYWDRQSFDIASYCLINTSPYFTAMANGNSKMYRYSDICKCVSKAGLVLEKDIDDLGISHTLMICKKNKGLAYVLKK